MNVSNDELRQAVLADFQERLSAMVQHQKRACVLMAARAMMAELTDTHQPLQSWRTHLRQALIRLISPVSPWHTRVRPGVELAPDEESVTVVDVEYWMLDDKSERRRKWDR